MDWESFILGMGAAMIGITILGCLAAMISLPDLHKYTPPLTREEFEIRKKGSDSGS